MNLRIYDLIIYDEDRDYKQFDSYMPPLIQFSNRLTRLYDPAIEVKF
jgi:hypothetical protein